MKVCVIGAGAIGGLMAGRLAALQSEKPADISKVSVLARGVTLQALLAHGVRIHSRIQTSNGGASDQWQAKQNAVNATQNAHDLGPQDLVVIAVKYNAMADIAAQIGPLLGPETVVLSAMNGIGWWFARGLRNGAPLTLDAVDPDGAVSAAIDPARVIGCVVHMAASVREPGSIQLNMGNRLIFGEPDGTQTERLKTTAALFSAAGFEVDVTDKIHRDVWYKLWGNMTMNPLSAVTGAQTDVILNDDLLRNFMSAAMMEANLVGERIGLGIKETPEHRHAITRKLGGFKTSMLQDVQAGRPLELDALVTVVRDIAEQVSVPAPNINALLGITRVFARSHGLT